MSVGLDLGTTEFRSIRDSGGDLIARRCRTAYLVLKDNPGHRRLLASTQAHFGTCGGDLVVFGDDADECSMMLDLPVTPLLREGRLPSSDPVARQILALIAEAVLPVAGHPGETCCLTLPGGYALEGDTASLDARYLKQLVALRGYSPQLVSAGQSIVLAELSDASFSGLGMSVGAVSCEVSVIHCGRELARCTVLSPLMDLDNEFLCARRQIGSEEPKAATVQLDWERNCQAMLTSILTEARESLLEEGSIKLIPQPLRIACAGGIVSADGFSTALQQAWTASGWPFKLGQIRIASNPRFSVARGCLIKAILENDSISHRQVA